MTTAASAPGDCAWPREAVANRRASRFDLAGIVESIRSVATLSEVLRILGGAVVLASMSVFLLQGWDDGNDMRRFLLLLTQTGLLAAGGFAMSHGLKEAKGARIFFGLALISITANFTVLGALVYSVFQWDDALTSYPGFATWALGDLAGLGVGLAGALLVLLPTALFCFMIMARPSAKALTAHFLPLNALLLLPVRESIAVGALALGATAFALWRVRHLWRQDPTLNTGEGRFAILTLFIPLGILLLRTTAFYDVDSLMVAMLCGAAFLALRQASAFPHRHRILANLLDAASLPLAIVTAVALAVTFENVDGEVLAPLTALAYGAMATDVLRRARSRVVAAFGAFTVSFAIFTGFTLSVAVEPGLATALVALAAGLALGLAGAWLGSRSAMIGGAFTALAATALGFDAIVALFVDASWVSLAILGASAIALGSLLERHGVAIKLYVTERTRQLANRREQAVLDD